MTTTTPEPEGRSRTHLETTVRASLESSQQLLEHAVSVVLPAQMEKNERLERENARLNRLVTALWRTRHD